MKEDCPSDSSNKLADVCNGRCSAERRVHCRELAKWGRQLMMLVGLENVFQRALGTGQWRKFGKAIQTASRASNNDFELDLSKNCNWCRGSREKSSSLGSEQSLLTMNDALLDDPSSTLDHHHPLASPRLLAPLMTIPGHSSPPSASSSTSLSSASSFIHSSSSSSAISSSSVQLPPHSPKRVTPAPLEMPSLPSASSSTPNSVPDPMRLFAFHQQQMLMGSTEAMSGAERMALAAAMQLLLSASMPSSAGQNGTSFVGGSAAMLSPPAASAFLPTALFSPAGFCAWPPILAPHAPLAPFVSLPNNGSSATSPSSPPSSAVPPNFFDIHQQLAMAWQSQMFALSLMGSLNGFCPPPFSAGVHRDQMPSEDEALAFLAAFGNNTRTKTPTENGEQQPLDLTKAATSFKQMGKEKRLAGKSIKSGDQLPRENWQQKGDKDEGNASAPPLLLVGTDSVGGEDSSEAESPKLGTKRTYSQADLDAAVTDIRMGRLGTRRASVVYGIPRSTLRNKIYKLEAAEDNGDGSSKRRRLTAFAIHKREQRLLAHRSLTESASGDSSLAEGGEYHGSEGPAKRVAESPGDAEEQSDEPMPQMPVVLLRQQSMPTFPFLGAGVGSAEQLLKEFSSMVQQNQQKSMSMSAGENVVEGECMKSEEGKQEQKQQQQNRTSKTTRGEQQSGTPPMKRPKRGQYRKYEKEALDKAVASVRSGEMSVHRAGSFFGVPHSTLEYKVKERNLLRTKSKKALGANGGSPKSSGGSESRQSAEKQKVVVESEVQKMVELMLDTVVDSAKSAAGEANADRSVGEASHSGSS